MQPRGMELLVVPAMRTDASAYPIVRSSLSLDGVIAYAHGLVGLTIGPIVGHLNAPINNVISVEC